MDFELSNQQKDIIKAAREFAEKEISEVARECDEKEEVPTSVWKKACELGFVGVFIGKEYGGPGLGNLEHCLILEEFWKVDPGCGAAISTCFGSEMIVLFGSEEQKKRYLPLIVKGQAISGAAITEPNAGSDVSSVATSAVKDGEEYVINGNKTFITNGTRASYLVVLCLTNPDNTSRYNRHSVLIVETDREGFEATKIKNKLGIRASDTADISFESVRVPRTNLVGEEGKGFQQFMGFFNCTRIHVCAQAVGIAQGAMGKAIKYVKERKQFGKAIASFQNTQFKIAEMATRIAASRNLYYQAAWMADQGKFDPKLAAMAKLISSETAVWVANEALQLHGGYGFIAEYDVQRYYRDAKIVEIYEGTREIEKLIIGRALLGKYD